MHYIKVNNSKGLAEINTEDDDWLQQLRDCTTEVPAVIRTPKGFKTVMENMGYISLNESSPYTDLWMSFGDELPSEDLPSNSAVFMCSDSRTASEFLDTRVINIDTPCLVLLQTCRLSESRVGTFYSRAAGLAGLASSITCSDLAHNIRNLNVTVTHTTTRIIITMTAEDLESLNANKINALANAIAEAERNPKITLDVVLIGTANWTVNFKNIYSVRSVPDGYYVCRGLNNEYKQGKACVHDIQRWLDRKTKNIVNFLDS